MIFRIRSSGKPSAFVAALFASELMTTASAASRAVRARVCPGSLFASIRMSVPQGLATNGCVPAVAVHHPYGSR